MLNENYGKSSHLNRSKENHIYKYIRTKRQKQQQQTCTQ